MWSKRWFVILAMLVAPLTAQAMPTRMYWPVGEVTADLARSLGCVWTTTPSSKHDCPLLAMGGYLTLYPDTDGSVESVEFNPKIATDPRDRATERASRETVFSIVRYFLPMWREGPAWLSKAMRDVVQPHTKRVTHVGPITVMVHWLQPNLPDTYAVVVFTKRASLAEFEKGLSW